jgi:hypothetical protein
VEEAFCPPVKEPEAGAAVKEAVKKLTEPSEVADDVVKP